MNEKALALFFYEQCAGTFTGHMANVPNNPTIHTLVRASSEKGSSGNTYAATKNDFAKFLRGMADQLESADKF